MRCKPGDLALVVNDFEMPCNNGAILRVLKRADPADYIEDTIDWDCEAVSTVHCYDGSIFFSGQEGFGYRDVEFRPLRPSTRKDESLTWAPRHETS